MHPSVSCCDTAHCLLHCQCGFVHAALMCLVVILMYMFLHLLQFANSAPAQAKRMRDMAKAAAGQQAAAQAAAATPRVRRRWRCGVSGCQSQVVNVPEHLDRHFATRSCPEVLRRLRCGQETTCMSLVHIARVYTQALRTGHDLTWCVCSSFHSTTPPEPPARRCRHPGSRRWPWTPRACSPGTASTSSASPAAARLSRLPNVGSGQ